MKFPKILIAAMSMLILFCGAAAAASEKDQAVEGFLERLTYSKAGDGEKTVFIVCNPECPRCERLSAAIDALPAEQAAEFEFRWIMQPGGDMELLYVMESGSVSEMYKKKQPRPIANQENMMFTLAYNAAILGQVFRHLPPPSMTPIVIAKKDGVFRILALEDIQEKVYETLQGSGKVASKPALPIVKEIFSTFDEIRRPVTLMTISETPVRILPVDDSPAVDIVGADFSLTPVIEHGEWYGVEFENPPFLFIKKSELKEAK